MCPQPDPPAEGATAPAEDLSPLGLLVAECASRLEAEGDAAVDAVCHAHPDLADARRSAAEQLAAVMEHDFRSTKRQAGIGLGLGVARHVVRAHGGTLTAESHLGEGTVFRVTLPRSDRERRGET